MRILKVLLVLLLVVGLVLSFGCAARQTVQKETPAQDIESTGVVEEPADVPSKKGKGKTLKYVVKKGDTLWDIAAKENIYKDNFLWPLLFKANRDQIEDPDIIEIGQELTVRKDWSKAEMEDARQKAKDTPPYVPHTKPRKPLPLKY
ncbi:MAG: LysM peptidoglycan-binding domain-containing protein [Candidatus Goldbacteria bacterium]|nr:LysM peptidoglycan-binding domain-containing protein [Candidatus Goldiibacteriota bacterium]